MGPISRRMTPLIPLWAMAQQVMNRPQQMPGATKPDASRPLTNQTGGHGSRNISNATSTNSLLITERIGKPATRALSGAENIPVYATTGLQQTTHTDKQESVRSGWIWHQAQDDAMRAFHFGEWASIADALSASVAMQGQTARLPLESAIQKELHRAAQTIIDNMGNDKIIRNARGEVIAVWKYNPEDGTYRIQTYS